MTPDSNTSDDAGNESGSRISRRRVLKAAGAGAAGIAVFSGSASAHGVFYGCSQVCTHEDLQRHLPGTSSSGSGRKAVVYNSNTQQCECRDIVDTSNRNDPRSRTLRDIDPNDNVYCYEAASYESIVGICTSEGFSVNTTNEFHDSTSDGQCVKECTNFTDAQCETC